MYHPKGPFLTSNRLERLEFAWNTIKDTSKQSNSVSTKDAFKRASANDNVKRQLTTFTMYGRTALISNIITKARSRVKGFFGFKGDKVKDDIEWLLKDSKFMYGGVNVEKREYNNQEPFGCDLIVDIIEAQWFSTTSRSNADAETSAKIAAEKDLPLTIIILAVTVIEHAIKEWNNGRKATPLAFTEDIAKQSYNHHLGNWNILAEKSPKWTSFWRQKLLKRILTNQEDVYGDSSNGSDLAGVDFGQLDALATAEMGEQEAS
ncbi:hypothetical protein BDN70DRAFT_935557 [Pholiota conissans]|uniref:DUF6532 domain-containing protein n=1 Tax=Pholiota conissans TaxID=109636 RepID=A0A9P6CR56_9AGAR|nr:hypothetical protein BDN70DRAFT_935557 [Pholiota conissans]